MDPDAFRAAAHEVVDRIADYLRDIERYPVLPPIEPGSIAPLLPSAAPDRPEPLAAILADIDRLVDPERDPLAAPGLLRVLRHAARPGPGCSASS